MGTLEPKAVIGYIKEITSYLSWLSDMRVGLSEVGVILLCSYFRVAIGRGRSVPSKVRSAMIWCEKHTRTRLGADVSEVRAFVAQLTFQLPSGQMAKAPYQAPPLPVEYVIALEGLVLTAHTLPLRIFAGIACACVHGVKRWADVLHSVEVVASADALSWVTYKSKKKHAPLKWAALRIGFSGADWGAPFLSALSEANLTKFDFLVERPTRDLCGFTRSPADWSDATRVLQALLVMSGINATEAAGFTFHSCRHTYPTCAS